MVLIPIAALIALALVAPGPERPSVAKASSVVAGIFVLLVAARTIVPDDLLWPDSEAARRARWAVRHLEKSGGWESRPLIILTGSSSTLFGLDPLLLEKNLARSGTPATVLSFSMAGATFYERRYMVESFLRQLGAEGRKKLRESNLVFLNEVFDAYDLNPLYRFQKEAFSERVVQFLGPGNAWDAWLAYRRQIESDPGLPSWTVAGMLMQHAVINRFGTGAFSSMRWPWRKMKASAPFCALDEPESSFDFEKTLRVWQASTEPGMRPDAFTVSGQWEKAYGDLAGLLKPYAKRNGFYCLPVIEPQRASYAKRFADRMSADYLVVEPPGESDLAPLLRPEFWFDGVHVTGRGVPLLNEWFAREIAQRLR